MDPVLVIIDFHFECKVEHDEKASRRRLEIVGSGLFGYEARLLKSGAFFRLFALCPTSFIAFPHDQPGTEGTKTET